MKIAIRVRTATSAALAFIAVAGAAHANVTDVRLFVTNYYYQNSSGTSYSSSDFESDALVQNGADFTSAETAYPNGVLVLPPAAGSNGTLYVQGAAFPSLAALQAAFPFGDYVTTLTNSATSYSNGATIQYTANDFPLSGLPTILNYSALQGASAGSPLTIDFPSFTPNPLTADTVGTFLDIYNQSNGSLAFGTFVSPSTTSVTIPAGTLAAGVTYTFNLNFGGRVAATDPTTGIPTEAGFANVDFGTFSTAVPEPAAWTMMLVGVGAIGSRLRASRRRDGGVLLAN